MLLYEYITSTSKLENEFINLKTLDSTHTFLEFFFVSRADYIGSLMLYDIRLIFFIIVALRYIVSIIRSL